MGAAPRKPRSLADLLDEQVKTGVVKKEDLAKPVWTQQQQRAPRVNTGFSTREQQPWGDPRKAGGAPANSSLNWQQQAMMGRGTGSSSQRSETRPRAFAPPSSHDADMPSWAATDVAAGASISTLNWQQQSLLNRDDSDPFNRFVRGENEYARE